MKRSTIALLAASVVAATMASPASALAGASTPAGESSSAVQTTLSNLRTLSRWAYPEAAATAYASPSAHSHAVGHLRFLTEDGQAEVYMALRSYRARAHKWIEVALPGRPNGVTGWVRAYALGEMHVVHDYLRINREALRATLYRDGRPVWSAPVGVGRPSLPTPVGHFYVREKLRGIGGNPLYGPYALGTSAYAPSLTEWPGGGVVGIHGTNEPQLIPGRPSHGCIRLRNPDITRLWHLISVGTPIEIL
ncbi:MAG TPA: L,D-transpeptidase [Gaiellales bacterium]|nr:L,D-transpeptidase [Gaiellales bacterium]